MVSAATWIRRRKIPPKQHLSKKETHQGLRVERFKSPKDPLHRERDPHTRRFIKTKTNKRTPKKQARMLQEKLDKILQDLNETQPPKRRRRRVTPSETSEDSVSTDYVTTQTKTPQNRETDKSTGAINVTYNKVNPESTSQSTQSTITVDSASIVDTSSDQQSALRLVQAFIDAEETFKQMQPDEQRSPDRNVFADSVNGGGMAEDRRQESVVDTETAWEDEEEPPVQKDEQPQKGEQPE
ncbi:hypothetical protein EAI_10747 [Harpegnathos saltator]|uniref:Uncharacterized protein n=1 Tax=Harpegnathos saltator TaxID=610380 RepID=E2BIR1_HARSA|nr:hypothetical protein EAI_10747 [Harpegnathos saltator]